MQLSILDRFAEFRKQWKQTSEIRGQFKPQWAILIISVVSLGFLIIVFGLFQKTQIELQEADRLKTQTEVVEKNLVENLKAASNVLFSIRDSLPVWQRTESKAIINQRLNQTIQFLPGFRTIFILDKNGICIYSTRPELLGEDLSMREYYISAKSASNSNGTRDTKGNSKTYISAPFYSSITKVSIFTIGQIIEDQNGQFNGMIATALKPEFFSTLLSSVNYSTDMSSAVIDDNGNVLMIRPDRFQLPFDRTNILESDTFFSRHILSSQRFNVMTGRWIVDSQERMIALRTITVADFTGKLIIVLSRDLKSIRSSWFREMIVLSLLFTLLIVGSVITLYIYQSDQLNHLIEKQRMATLLEEREHDLSSILDSVTSLISYWDFNLKNRFSNRSFGKWIDQKPINLVGQTIQQVMGSEFEQIKEYVESTLTGKPQIFERNYLSSNGLIHYYRESYIPDLRKGKVLGFYAVSTDITDIRNSELKAEQANRAKTQFLANMSHEIRTPMNAIIGLTELMRRTSLNVKQSDYLKKISISSKHLLHVLNDILDYSKIESEQMNIEEIDFSIRDVISSAEEMFSFMANEKGLNIQILIDEKIPNYVKGDPFRIGQVINNLVSNSIKFTEKGQILITVNCSELTESNCIVEFSVADTGIGIDQEVMDQLFQPFSQADSSTTRKFGGTGLGLAISQKLVNAMNSQIFIDEHTKNGSRFYFTLTLPISENKSVNKAQKQTVFQAGKARLLLVEDNEINRQVGEELLRQFGFRVDTAINGLEALSIIEESNVKYDAILMDLQMPVMDGFEATKRIRKLFAKDELPIIAVSAAVQSSEREQSVKVGMNGFITKPFEVSELLKILKLCIKTETGSSDSVAAKLKTAPVQLAGFELDQPLQKLSGNWPSLKRLLQLFAEQILPMPNQIKSALADDDLDQFEKLLHSLKGMSGDLGAIRLYSISSDLNIKLKSNQRPLPTEIEELKLALTEVIDSLQNQLH